MRRIVQMTCLSLSLAGIAYAGTTNEAVYVKTMEQAQIILESTVVEEGPLGSGGGSQKSYRVEFKVVYWRKSIVSMPNLASTIWIHFDSEEFSKELQTGLEDNWHKGDRFIAFLNYGQQKKGWEFRIVRTDKPAQLDSIKKELRLRTEPPAGGDGKPAPQP
jgi:hypothetical protein